MPNEGSLRAVAGDLVKQYGLRYLAVSPLVTGLAVGVVTGLLGPRDINGNDAYDHWSP
jgi:hypothetical protein